VVKSFHIHLVSDSTGETAGTLARACLAQFDNIQATEHLWNLIRKESQIKEVLKGIEANPGFVLYTLVEANVRKALEEGCRRLRTPCISVLEPMISALGLHLGAEVHAWPGKQHVMDAEYFSRIEAMQFVLSHDDGQSSWNIGEADVLVLGVSRTSKTPTCIYLANRGIKAANVPIVPGCALPPEILEAEGPLIVGLTNDPKRLVQIRRNRMRMLSETDETDYVDPVTVASEVNDAKRLFVKHGWPVIDVTRRSVEEIAATIINYLNRRQEEHP